MVTTGPSVLLVGLRSSAVDFEKWPQLTKEKLEAAFEEIRSELTHLGYRVQWCLTDTGETAEQQLTDDLRDFQPDIVLIGAGVRVDPDCFLLFEKMVNIVLQNAPKSRIAFNSNPHDTIAAVRRWT